MPVRRAGRATANQEPRSLRTGSDHVPGLADRLLLRWQGTPSPGRGHRRAGGGARPDRRPGRRRAEAGGGRVEGYPEDATSVPAGFLYNGALSTYENLGFTRERKIGKHRWVVTMDIEPSS